MRRQALERMQRLMLAIVALIALIIGVMMWQSWQKVAPSLLPGWAVTPTPAPRVGIVAGHWGSDSGAVCADGLQEVDINLAIATRVVALLQKQGYRVDLLHEFDEDMAGYRGDAFVSLHSDSCDVPGVSGFKVARVSNSAIPEAEDRLVRCLYDEYEAATGLPRHENSITDDMRVYHAFRKIDRRTPGAIIEMGFMADDRQLLLNRQDVAAQGIFNGILCFLEDRLE